jgi:secreted trypsin-like serine protease
LLGALIAAVVASLVGFVQSGKAIVGGEEAKHLKYPFMVALRSHPGGGFVCSGSLIKSGPGGEPLYVLTAAHCLADEDGVGGSTRVGREINRRVITTPDGVKIYDLKVEVGKTDLTNPRQGQAYWVRENDIFIHESYQTGGALSPLVYDVAVVKLFAPPGTTAPPTPKPEPIKLATSREDDMEKPGRIVTTLGWGATTIAGKPPSDVLKWAQVPIVSDDAAKKRYGTDYLPDLLVAAGGLPGTGVCFGDSGGVLFSRDTQQTPYQIGVTSRAGQPPGGSISKCPTGYPDIYAEVNEPRIRNWIVKKIAEISAEIPRANGKIYFASRGSVWSMNPDGTGQTKLLGNNDNNAEDNPAVSPDGARIAYVFANNDIHVMNADGSGVKRITTDRNTNQDPAWSPDNKRIVFSRKGLQNRQDLFVVNSDGTGLRNLTNTPDISEEDPAWSPDGSQIAYTAVGCAGGGRCVYVMAANGTKPENLTNEPRLPGCASTHVGHLGTSSEPHWSPNKSQDNVYKIVFTGTVPCSNSTGKHIWVMNADGNSKKNLTKDNGTLDRHPVFSPDYKQIAFQRDGDIYTMQVEDPTNQVNITKTAGVAEETPHWGPTPKR